MVVHYTKRPAPAPPEELTPAQCKAAEVQLLEEIKADMPEARAERARAEYRQILWNGPEPYDDEWMSRYGVSLEQYVKDSDAFDKLKAEYFNKVRQFDPAVVPSDFSGADVSPETARLFQIAEALGKSAGDVAGDARRYREHQDKVAKLATQLETATARREQVLDEPLTLRNREQLQQSVWGLDDEVKALSKSVTELKRQGGSDPLLR